MCRRVLKVLRAEWWTRSFAKADFGIQGLAVGPGYAVLHSESRETWQLNN